MDPVKRAAMFIRMNDLVVDNVAVIPIVTGTGTFAISKTLQGFDFSPYSGPLWRLVYWYREA
jgi:peptide/nickel transport system substrate-binding protein